MFCFHAQGQADRTCRAARLRIDFAYAVHSQVGDKCVGAKVNGRLMPLRHELQNGDQVEIMTARDGVPSPAWERFVVTGKARARIRRYIAQQQRQNYVDAGRAALAKAFRQEGLDGSEKVLEASLKGLKAASLDDLYVSVGNGNVGPKDVVHSAYPELRQASRAPRMVPSLTPRPGRVPGRDSGLQITGLVAGMAVHYAGCCHPVPGDHIVGIVATGKGVTIHTRECQTLESFASTPERFIDVGWEPPSASASGKPVTHTGRISAIAINQPSTLASLTNAVSKHDGAVTNLRITNRQQDFFEVLLDVEVRDLRHLSNVIAGLRAASGVTQVERARG